MTRLDKLTRKWYFPFQQVPSNRIWAIISKQIITNKNFRIADNHILGGFLHFLCIAVSLSICIASIMTNCSSLYHRYLSYLVIHDLCHDKQMPSVLEPCQTFVVYTVQFPFSWINGITQLIKWKNVKRI